MFPILFLAMVSILLFASRSNLRSPLNRMSLAFQTAHKPYQPVKPKPKGGTKDKFMHLMAIAKYAGTGVVGLSGKIAGTVFLNNGVVRVWHKTKTVRNAATNLVKGIFGGESSAYKTLTPAQLLAWANAAVNYLRKNALAEVKTLSAIQAFKRVNNILTSLGILNAVNPPGVGTTDSITVLTATADTSAQTLLLAATTFGGAVVLPANCFLKVYATTQHTASKQRFSKSDYRYIGFLAPGGSLTAGDMSADYLAKFPAFVTGQRIGVAVEWILASGGPPPTLFKQNGKVYTDTIVVA